MARAPKRRHGQHRKVIASACGTEAVHVVDCGNTDALARVESASNPLLFPSHDVDTKGACLLLRLRLLFSVSVNSTDFLIDVRDCVVQVAASALLCDLVVTAERAGKVTAVDAWKTSDIYPLPASSGAWGIALI